MIILLPICKYLAKYKYFRAINENTITMKQKPTFKSLLVVASIFSLFAFIFVNGHAGFGTKIQGSDTVFVETQIEEADNEGKLPVPDVTVLGSLLDIAHKLIDRKN